MAVKLADAFIQITASAENLQKDISNQLAGLGKVGQDAGKDIGKAMSSEVEKAGKSFEKSGKAAGSGYGAQFAKEAQASLGGLGDRIMGGIGKGMLAGAAVAGTAVAGTLGAAIGKGFSRLTNIDQAESKLRGLGHAAEDVAGIMSNANAAVKGTAFGLDDAATAAAGAVAAGIEPGKELERTLTLMGDAATIAGTDMGSMSSIFNKVATDGRLQGDVIAQLGDAGIPVLSLLSKELGVTSEEVRKMASDGEINFEMFQNAMEAGLGGAALESGNTFKGALANAGAAMGRFGASLAAPVFDNAPVVFGAIGDAFGLLQEKVGPLAEQFGEWLAPKVAEFAENLGPWLVDRVESFATSIGDLARWLKDNAVWLKPVAAGLGALAGVITTAAVAISTWNKVMAVYKTVTAIATGQTLLFNNALKTNVIILVVSALAALVAGLVYFFTQTETGKKAWETFTTALADGWNWATEKVGGGIDWLQEKFDKFTGWISDAWNGVTSLFGKGDYTGEMSRAFGIEEDSPIISFFFTVRDLITDIKGYITGVWDILFKGDYTGLPFGLEEDSGLVNFFFTLRETVIKTGEIITAVWDGIVKAGKIAFAILGTIVLTPLILAWNYLSSQVQEGWEKVIKPAWDGMSAAATWMWETAIKPALEAISEKWDLLQLVIAKAVFEVRLKIYEFQAAVTALWAEYVQPILDLIRGKWDELATAMTATWQSIKTAVFDAWNWYVTKVQENWAIVTGALNAAWTAVKDTFMPIWETIRTAVFDAWNAYVDRVKANWDIVTGALNTAWEGVKSVFGATWDWIRDNVFSKFNSAIDLMRSGAETAMDGIGKAFDWLREKTAKPVNFVIETVYMGGIRKAWGAVASLVDLEELPKIDKIGGYARGGILPGYTPGRDPFTFIEPTTGMSIGLSGGEAIMRPEATRALGSDWVDGVNAAARVGGKQGVEKFLGHFASGGVVPSIVNIVREKFPMMSITSTYRNTNDHHGAGKAVDFSNGTDSTPGMRSAAQYFAENYGRSLLELIHSPSPFNIKNGQSVGDGFGFYGAGTMNAHRNHVHVAANNPLPGGGTGGVLGVLEGAVGWVGDQVKKIWDGIINVIPKFDGGGLIGGLPGGFLSKAGDAAWSWISDKLDTIGAFFGSPGAGVEQWRPMVESVLASKGFSTDLADTVLRRMNQESGGDPRAINLWDSNATAGVPSKGLMQVIDPTFAAHKDPGFNDIWDPESNLRASMNYAMGRYGSLPAAYNRAGGYHDGGLAPAGQGLMHKTALEPEMVLSPKMTQAFIDWMRGTPGGQSAAVVARELAEAFNGGDWGMGELASYIGIELAESTINVVAAIGKADRGFREWAESETVTEARRKFEGDSRDALIGGGRSLAVESLDLVGLGAVVDIAEGVGGKIHGIMQDEEVREAVKKVQLDPDMSYSGREVEKKLRELGVDVERIKSQLSGGVLGGLVGMA